MNSYLHIMFSYLRRFWREVVALFVVSITGSLWLAMHPSSLPSSAITVVELAIWLWFALRLMQAESTYTTLGGWRLRPLARHAIPVAQWLCYLTVMTPLVALRIFLIPLFSDAPRKTWMESGFYEFGYFLASVVLAALVLYVCGLIAKRGAASRWTAGILGGSCALLLAIAMSAPRQSYRGSMNSGSSYIQMPEAARALMKPGDHEIELIANRYPATNHLVAADQFVTLPLHQGSVVYHEGIRCEVVRAQFAGDRVDVRLDLSGAADKLGELPINLLLVIRYGNGYWGWPRLEARDLETRSLPGAGITYKMEVASLTSPLVYPWCRDHKAILQGAELHLLIPLEGRALLTDPHASKVSSSVGNEETKINLPDLSASPSSEQLREATLAAVCQLQIGWWQEGTDAITLLNKIGKNGLPHILECITYDDAVWNRYLKNLIITHADQNDLQAIRKRAETDTRFCEVMLAKNWNDEVRPILRKHALNGLPLDARSFRFVAEQRDPSLAVALTKLALISPSDGRAIVLKDHPGVNWEMLVRDACRKTAFGSEKPEEFWLNESAILGERQWLMDRVASWLQSQKSPTKEQIHQWISSASWDADVSQFTTWLREYVTKLTWNNELKKWTL